MSILKPLLFLATTPIFNLPKGNKANVEQAQKECKLWIETAASTAASTAVATALVFPTLIAVRYLQTALVNSGRTVGINDGTALNILSIVGGSLLNSILLYQYRRIDTQASLIANVFLTGYYYVNSALQGNVILLASNLSVLSSDIYSTHPFETIRHTGYLRPYIESISQSWAPAMASFYGYRAST